MNDIIYIRNKFQNDTIKLINLSANGSILIYYADISDRSISIYRENTANTDKITSIEIENFDKICVYNNIINNNENVLYINHINNINVLQHIQIFNNSDVIFYFYPKNINYTNYLTESALYNYTDRINIHDEVYHGIVYPSIIKNPYSYSITNVLTNAFPKNSVYDFDYEIKLDYDKHNIISPSFEEFNNNIHNILYTSINTSPFTKEEMINNEVQNIIYCNVQRNEITGNFEIHTYNGCFDKIQPNMPNNNNLIIISNVKLIITFTLKTDKTKKISTIIYLNGFEKPLNSLDITLSVIDKNSSLKTYDIHKYKNNSINNEIKKTIILYNNEYNIYTTNNNNTRYSSDFIELINYIKTTKFNNILRGEEYLNIDNNTLDIKNAILLNYDNCNNIKLSYKFDPLDFIYNTINYDITSLNNLGNIQILNDELIINNITANKINDYNIFDVKIVNEHIGYEIEFYIILINKHIKLNGILAMNDYILYYKIPNKLTWQFSPSNATYKKVNLKIEDNNISSIYLDNTTKTDNTINIYSKTPQTLTTYLNIESVYDSNIYKRIKLTTDTVYTNNYHISLYYTKYSENGLTKGDEIVDTKTINLKCNDLLLIYAEPVSEEDGAAIKYKELYWETNIECITINNENENICAFYINNTLTEEITGTITCTSVGNTSIYKTLNITIEPCNIYSDNLIIKYNDITITENEYEDIIHLINYTEDKEYYTGGDNIKCKIYIMPTNVTNNKIKIKHVYNPKTSVQIDNNNSSFYNDITKIFNLNISLLETEEYNCYELSVNVKSIENIYETIENEYVIYIVTDDSSNREDIAIELGVNVKYVYEEPDTTLPKIGELFISTNETYITNTDENIKYNECIYKFGTLYNGEDISINEDLLSLNYNELISLNRYNVLMPNVTCAFVYNNNELLGYIDLSAITQLTDEDLYEDVSMLIFSDLFYDINNTNISGEDYHIFNLTNDESVLDLNNVLYYFNDDVSTFCSLGNLTNNNNDNNILHLNNTINRYINSDESYKNFISCSGFKDDKIISIFNSIEEEQIIYENTRNKKNKSYYFVLTDIVFIILNIEDTEKINIDENKYYNDNTLNWLYNVLKTYSDKTCCIFSNLMLNGTGGELIDDTEIKYTSIHSKEILNGEQYEKIKSLYVQFINAIWFTGQTLYSFNNQIYNKNINIYKSNNASSTNIHIPSLSKPTIKDNDKIYTLDSCSEAVKTIFNSNNIVCIGYTLKNRDMIPSPSFNGNYITPEYIKSNYDETIISITDENTLTITINKTTSEIRLSIYDEYNDLFFAKPYVLTDYVKITGYKNGEEHDISDESIIGLQRYCGFETTDNNRILINSASANIPISNLKYDVGDEDKASIYLYVDPQLFDILEYDKITLNLMCKIEYVNIYCNKINPLAVYKIERTNYQVTNIDNAYFSNDDSFDDNFDDNIGSDDDNTDTLTCLRKYIIDNGNIIFDSSINGELNDNYVYRLVDNDNNPINEYKEMNTNEIENGFIKHSFIDENVKQINVYDINNIDNDKPIGYIDITNLKRTGSSTLLYTVGLLSDVHYADIHNDSVDDLDNLEDNPQNGEHFKQDFENALNYLSYNKVNMICIAGDVTTDHIAHLDNFFDMYTTETNRSIPIFACQGNHDCDALYRSDGNTYIPDGESNITKDDNNALLISPDEYYTDCINMWKSMFGKDSGIIKNYASEGNETSFYIEYNNDIYIFLDLHYTNYDSSSAGDGHYYRPETLTWFAEKLEEFEKEKKRCFVFTHLFFWHKAGNNNVENGYFDYFDSKNGDTDNNVYCLRDLTNGDMKQFAFLNELNNTYKNVVWFTGHSHYKWEWQTVEPNMNICNYDSIKQCESAYNVHLSSCAQPLIISNGYYNQGGSEGAIMYVFDDHIEIKCIEFKISESTDNYINKFIPYCSFNIPIIQYTE